MISQGCHTWMPDKCLIIPQNILLSLHALSPCSFLHHTEPFKCHCKNYLSKVFIYYLASQLFLLWTPTDLAYASLYHSSLLSLVTEPHTLACYIYHRGCMGRRYGLTTCQIPLWGFPCGVGVKNLPANAGVQVRSWIGKIFWRRKWQPTPVFLPGKFYGQRSLWRAAVCEVTKSQMWLSTAQQISL